MNVKTTRFGELKVNQEDVISLKDGMLGFENLKKFLIVDPDDGTLVLWFQSLENSSVAFPIIEPKIFKPDYIAKLLPADLSSVELESLNNAKIYSILTIPSDITKMNANLKAPIVINSDKKIAKQIVLQDSKLAVNHEMYKDLKKFIMSYSSDDTKRTNVQNTKTTTVTNEDNTSTVTNNNNSKTELRN